MTTNDPPPTQGIRYILPLIAVLVLLSVAGIVNAGTDPSQPVRLIGGEIMVYQMDADDWDNPSTGEVFDRSGNGNHATYVGASNTDSFFLGNEFSTSGSGSLDFPDSALSGLDDWTIVYYVEESNGVGQRMLVLREGSAGSLDFDHESGEVWEVNWWSSGPTEEPCPTDGNGASLTPGSYIAATFDNSTNTVTMYDGNTQVASCTVGTGALTGDSTLDDGSGNAYDEFRFYNRVLSASELGDIMTEPYESAPTTSFTWNFNQTNAQNGYFSGSASAFTPHWWNWTFGDGSFSNGTISDVTHLYDSLGTFTVTLNASTINGSTFDTSTQTITVTELGNGTVTEVKDSELVFGLRTGWDPDSYKVWVRTSNPGNSLFGYDTNLNPDIDRSICTETDEFSNSRRDQLAVRVSGDRLVFSCALNTGGGNAYIYDIPSNSLTFAGTDGNDTATEFGWYNDNYINERSTGDELLLADLTEPGCGPTDANCVDVPIPKDTKHSAFDPGTLPSLTERLTCITGDNGSRCYRLNETSTIIQTERDDSLTFNWVQVYNNEVYFFSNDLVKTDKDFNTLQSSIGESTSGFFDPRMSKSGTFFTTYHRENGTIQVYDSETLELVGKSNTVPTIQYLDVTPDDEWVFGSNRTHLFRWNLSNIITNEGYVTENVQETSEGSGGSDTPNTLEDEEPNTGFGADPANFAEENGISVSSAAFLFTILLIMVLSGYLYVTMGESRLMATVGAFAGLGIGIAFSWVPLWIMYFIGLSIALVLGVLVFRRV